MHDQEKSDSAIVAVKPSNKAGVPAAEAVEPRAGTKGNADQQSTHRTQSRARVTQALDRCGSAREALRRPPPRVGPDLESGSSGSVRGVQQWTSLPRTLVDFAHSPHRRRTSTICVRRDKAALSSGCKPHPATAPAGSNRSSHGGDEMAEAFGVAGHI